jgi:CheY-like chemotaxis protein
MEVSRITQGRMELRREPVLLADIVHGAVEDVAAMMRGARHTLNVTVDAPGAVVEADPTRLFQVVVNLLTNAAKYTPNGGVIGLELRVEGQEAVIAVRDNGIGIPAHALGTVFDMFSQLKPALDRSKGGLGIGLALVRGILALHGGSIGVDSAGEGCGSTFTVRLPLAQVEATPASIDAALDTVRPASVLVVDDNVDAAETLQMFLELSGCLARVAHSAGEALDVLDGFQPQVALFDIGLPDMNGYELARRVRRRLGGDALLLIAATGWGQEADKQLAFAAGFDHHLTKPIDFDKLRALLAAPRTS